MPVEEKLKELYEQQKPLECEFIRDGTRFLQSVVERMPAEDIDLIANLVIERLKEEKCLIS